MPSQFWNKRVILAKLETTAGTDAVPTGSANAMLVDRDLEIKPIEGEYIERNFTRPFFGSNGKILVKKAVRIRCKVEMTGGGAAGTPPKWAPLIKACGWSETISAGVDVQYSPVSSGFQSLSIYAGMDGYKHVGLMCMGDVSIELNANTIPMLNFDFLGLYAAPSDGAITSADFTGWITPVPVNTANTTGLSLNGYTSARMQGLTLQCGNQLVHRSLVGYEGIAITDRKVTGNFTIEADLLAAKNWFTDIINTNTGAFAVQHGQVAGNIVSITGPKMQVTEHSYSDSDNIAMHSMGMEMMYSGASGNDEIKITVK